MLAATNQSDSTLSDGSRALKHCLGVAALAALVLSLFLLVLPDRFTRNESADYLGFYRPVAENLLAGRGLVDDLDRPALRYPPGYPIFLAGALWLGDRVGLSTHTTELALLLILWSLTAVAVFSLTRRHWGDRNGWLASVVWIVYPPALWMAKQPNSELLFTPLLVATVLCFWSQVRRPGVSRTSLFALGGLAGLTMLVRPAAIGLGLLVAAAYLAVRWHLDDRKRAGLGVAIILAGNLAVVAPWEAWMYRQTGALLPLSSGSAPSLRDGLTFGVRDKGYREGTWIPSSVLEAMEEIHTEARRDQATQAVLGVEQTSGDLMRILAATARDNPGGVAGLVALKAARSWYGTDSQRFEGAILLIQLLFLTPAILAIIICLRGPPERRQLALVTVALVLYFWAMSMLVLSIARYLVPTYALMAALLPSLLASQGRRPSSGLESDQD